MELPHRSSLPLQKLITLLRPYQRFLEHDLRTAIDELLRNRGPLTERRRNLIARRLPRNHQLNQRRRIVLLRQLQLPIRQES